MCMIDDGARAEVYQSRTVKVARKDHHCGECGRLISAGESYQYIFVVYEGDASSYAICQHCLVPANWLIENCGGYLHEGVYEDFEEHGIEYRQLRAPVMRISVGMRRKWLRFDGAGLMPVPRMPPSIEEAVNGRGAAA